MAVQDHIHLAMTTGGTPEFAPVYKWPVRFPDFAEIPDPIIGLQRTNSGRLEKHVLRGPSGPLVFQNFRFIVRVGPDYTYTVEERIDQLKAMVAQPVYFCPPRHAADGADHTADWLVMFLAKVGDIVPLDPLMQRFYVPVELVDDHTA